jgi:hypothetical protein
LAISTSSPNRPGGISATGFGTELGDRPARIGLRGKVVAAGCHAGSGHDHVEPDSTVTQVFSPDTENAAAKRSTQWTQGGRLLRVFLTSQDMTSVVHHRGQRH